MNRIQVNNWFTAGYSKRQAFGCKILEELDSFKLDAQLVNKITSRGIQLKTTEKVTTH